MRIVLRVLCATAAEVMFSVFTDLSSSLLKILHAGIEHLQHHAQYCNKNMFFVQQKADINLTEMSLKQQADAGADLGFSRGGGGVADFQKLYGNFNDLSRRSQNTIKDPIWTKKTLRRRQSFENNQVKKAVLCNFLKSFDKKLLFRRALPTLNLVILAAKAPL